MELHRHRSSIYLGTVQVYNLLKACKFLKITLNHLADHCQCLFSGSGSVSGNVLQRMSHHTVVTVNSNGGTCNAEAVHK